MKERLSKTLPILLVSDRTAFKAAAARAPRPAPAVAARGSGTCWAAAGSPAPPKPFWGTWGVFLSVGLVRPPSPRSDDPFKGFPIGISRSRGEPGAFCRRSGEWSRLAGPAPRPWKHGTPAGSPVILRNLPLRLRDRVQQPHRQDTTHREAVSITWTRLKIPSETHIKKPNPTTERAKNIPGLGKERRVK